MEVLDKINSVIWGSFTVILILVIGIYFTVKSRFIQFTFIKKLSLKKQGSIGAVTAALAASLGTGNITGCAAAIAVGGIGAIFWMWVSAFFGMAIAYAENHVGISCIQKYGGSGPMSYMENMIGSKVLTVIYAIGCGATALFVGSATQANAFVTAVSPYFNISSLLAALILAAITAVILLSGSNAVSAVMSLTEKIVPFMGVLYMGGAAAVIAFTHCNVLDALGNIIRDAFSSSAVSGGMLSSAISIGLRRGVFSNEAGMGSSVMVYSCGGMTSAETAGAWGSFEVFLDTIICCTVTALAVIAVGETDITYVFSSAFSAVGAEIIGRVIITASICLFAYASILGWFCYGQICVDYLTDSFIVGKKAKGIVTKVFPTVYTLFIIIGGMTTQETALAVADICNAFVMFPNLLSVVYLYSREVKPDRQG